jgi:hypothetical protein
MKIQRRHYVATLFAAGATTLALAAAPTANSAPTGPACVSVGQTATQCQSPGNAEIVATPPPVNYQAQYPFFGPYGLIFHHGGHHH